MGAATVQVTCRGIRPFLMNPATPQLMEQIRTRTSPPRRTDWSVEEEAATKLSWGDDFGYEGRIGIPSDNLFACLRHAGRQVKQGTKQISTASSTLLPMYMAIQDEFLAFKIDGDVNEAWKPDVRRGVNPNGGEMVVLVRPKFPQWEFDVTITIEDNIDNGVIRKLFDIAGSACGLGDFRPQKGGQFGRFAVTNWVEQGSSKNGKGKETR